MSRAAAAALLLACAGVLTWAGARADAAWQFFAAETITAKMVAAGNITPAGIDQAAGRVEQALARLPANPAYLDLAGHLHGLRAAQPGVVGEQRRQALQASAQHYRQALAARPLWPYGWANLLAVKDQLGEADNEFDQALNRAAATGPWEPRVQLQVVRSGVRYWDALGQPERRLVEQTMRDALSVQPREAFEIARLYARPDLVCDQVTRTGQPQIDRWCNHVQAG